MKKINIVSLLILIITLSACEQDFEDDNFRPRDRTSGWVQFLTDSIKTSNGIDTLKTSLGVSAKIPFSIQVPINNDGLNIDYTVESIDGNPPEGSVGSFTESIPEETKNTSDTLAIDKNLAVDRYSLKYTINDVDADNVSVGIEGSGRPTELFLDVCPVPLTWTGEEDFFGQSVTINLIPTDNPAIYEVENAWNGPTFQQLGPYPATFEIGIGQELIIESTGQDLLGGSGFINTCDGEMEYTLQQQLRREDPEDDESDFFDVTVTLTPAN